jgi:DNA-directed RNA polymerase subunit RPC12/RpoP
MPDPSSFGEPRYVRFRCAACGEQISLSQEELTDQLRELKFLRRADQPDRATLLQLVQACMAERLWSPCLGCGRPLAAQPETDDDAALEADPDWGDAVPCQQCGALIPPERLELFPTTRSCVKCQQQTERQGPATEAEYCPRCGDVLQLRLGQRGAAAYRPWCPSCRKSF